MLHKIFYGAKPKFTSEDRSLFSHGKFECKLLLKEPDGKPVIVSQCKDVEYPVWRVDYGFSSLFFRTYSEAMIYCKNRFVALDGKAM